MVKANVLPGWHLVVGTKSIDGWPKGHYALVRMNDPDFYWEGKPTLRPFHGLTAKQKNNASKALSALDKKWWEWLKKVEDEFYNDPMTCYNLVSACMKAGYRPKRDGYRIVQWLMEHLAKSIKRKVDET